MPSVRPARIALLLAPGSLHDLVEPVARRTAQLDRGKEPTMTTRSSGPPGATRWRPDCPHNKDGAGQIHHWIRTGAALLKLAVTIAASFDWI